MSSINPAPQPSSESRHTAPLTVEPLHHGGSGGGVKVAVLFGIVLALSAATVYLYMQLNETKVEMVKTRESLLSEIEKVREATTISSATHRRRSDTLKDQLEAAKRLASVAAGQAKVDAIAKVEELGAKIAVEQRRQEEAQQVIKADLSKVEQTATSATTKIGEVSTEVGSVKSEVASTKGELERTIANLKRVTGDVSSQGSLIATNSSELTALKTLGERNYVEFRINKTKDMQKIGDVAVLLKKADLKRNRYTIELLVDDKRVEKKDKTVNEPVQFITSKARQPYEIVVNEVKKDQIAGYLATPKVQTSRN